MKIQWQRTMLQLLSCLLDGIADNLVADFLNPLRQIHGVEIVETCLQAGQKRRKVHVLWCMYVVYIATSFPREESLTVAESEAVDDDVAHMLGLVCVHRERKHNRLVILVQLNQKVEDFEQLENLLVIQLVHLSGCIIVVLLDVLGLAQHPADVFHLLQDVACGRGTQVAVELEEQVLLDHLVEFGEGEGLVVGGVQELFRLVHVKHPPDVVSQHLDIDIDIDIGGRGRWFIKQASST